MIMAQHQNLKIKHYFQILRDNLGIQLNETPLKTIGLISFSTETNQNWILENLTRQFENIGKKILVIDEKQKNIDRNAFLNLNQKDFDLILFNCPVFSEAQNSLERLAKLDGVLVIFPQNEDLKKIKNFKKIFKQHSINIIGSIISDYQN